MNQKCITRLKAQTMHFMLHNTDWIYSSISTDDCRGFWEFMHIIPAIQHTDTYANIHPICSPFLRFCQLYKSPLDLDGADCSVAWETGYIQVFLRTSAEVSGNLCTLYLPFSIPIFTHIFILSVARFYVFASFIKDPLDLDGAICSVVCVTETGLSPSKARRRFPALCYSLLRRVVGFPPGRRQLSEMGGEM